MRSRRIAPAARAGLRADDRIVTIHGADASVLSEDEAVKAIRGPAGTVVTLTIERTYNQFATMRIERPAAVPEYGNAPSAERRP